MAIAVMVTSLRIETHLAEAQHVPRASTRWVRANPPQQQCSPPRNSTARKTITMASIITISRFLCFARVGIAMTSPHSKRTDGPRSLRLVAPRIRYPRSGVRRQAGARRCRPCPCRVATRECVHALLLRMCDGRYRLFRASDRSRGGRQATGCADALEQNGRLNPRRASLISPYHSAACAGR